LLPGTDAARAIQVTSDLVQALLKPFELEGQSIAVDASIGIAIAPEHGQDADTLLRCADGAMRQAKESGTGPALFRPDLDRHCPSRLAVLGERGNALRL